MPELKGCCKPEYRHHSSKSVWILLYWVGIDTVPGQLRQYRTGDKCVQTVIEQQETGDIFSMPRCVLIQIGQNFVLPALLSRGNASVAVVRQYGTTVH